MAPTFLFQEDTAFRHHNGDVAVDVALAVVVHQRNGDICVDDALAQRDTEDALGFWFCTGQSRHSCRLSGVNIILSARACIHIRAQGAALCISPLENPG